MKPRRIPELDFAWGRTANPNTADGELQNIAAFSGWPEPAVGSPAHRGRRRRVAHPDRLRASQLPIGVIGIFRALTDVA